ncbi:LysR substrate-binding domain-containing protein [Undibacterium sp. RuRC25W]|uniref:LysR substrate-binding domain-containing protein n=1 Tax=Undibacterium sp. RuRC25W TaxID=3413047 RepID=UPI003BF127BD
MDLKQLEYFVHVVELGSFTRASDVLNIAQPALSRQVRQLEVELRQNLLVRNGRGVTATEAGQLLLEHGRGILHQVARAKEDLGRIRGALAGRVNVGLPPSASKILTVPLTRAFTQRLPNASLSISEGLSTSMQEWLLTGRLDIALLYNPVLTTELEITPLAEEALYFVGPRNGVNAATDVTPITLKEIAQHALVIPNRPNAIRMLLETQMAIMGCKPLIHLEIDSVAAILDLVADGAGYAILTKYAVTTSAHPEAYIMRPIVEPQLLTRLTMATTSGRITTLTQNAMIALIKEVAEQVYLN